MVPDTEMLTAGWDEIIFAVVFVAFIGFVWWWSAKKDAKIKELEAKAKGDHKEPSEDD